MIVLAILVDLAILVLLARIVLAWLPVGYDTAAGRLYRVTIQLTEPVLAPVRALVRPVAVGGVVLDVAPALVLFVLALLGAVLR